MQNSKSKSKSIETSTYNWVIYLWMRFVFHHAPFSPSNIFLTSSLLFCLLKDGDVREWSTTCSDSKSRISWTSPERIWFHLISWSIFFIFSCPSNWETRATFHAATGATFHGATRDWLQCTRWGELIIFWNYSWFSAMLNSMDMFLSKLVYECSFIIWTESPASTTLIDSREPSSNGKFPVLSFEFLDFLSDSWFWWNVFQYCVSWSKPQRPALRRK